MVLGAVHFQCRMSHQGDCKEDGIDNICTKARRLYEVFCRMPVAVIADEMTLNASHFSDRSFAAEKKLFGCIQIDKVPPAYQAPAFHFQGESSSLPKNTPKKA